MKKTIICLIIFLAIDIFAISNVIADTIIDEIQGGYDIKAFISHSLENKLSMFRNDLRQSSCFNLNQPPLPPIINGPTKGTIDVYYTFSINPIVTPGLDSIYSKWDWGDGNITDWLGPYNSGQTIKESHMWTQSGVYDIRAKIKYSNDEESNWSETYMMTIVDNGLPTPPIIKGPINGKVGIKYKYTFNSTDLYNDELIYIINWGDGTQNEITGLSSHETFIYHTWHHKGVYLIKAKAKNIYGAESKWGTFETSIPRTRAVYNFNWLSLENRFPILHQLIQLI